MITEIKEKPKCPQCETTHSQSYGKFKDLETDGNYFTLEVSYCPECKFVYYSDIEFH